MTQKHCMNLPFKVECTINSLLALAILNNYILR